MSNLDQKNKKRVFIIHGWDGYPKEGWFPWLKTELEKHGFDVFIPQLPKAEEPRINNWVPFIVKAVEKIDNQTYFVGHSIGCQAIIRYLEKLQKDKKIGGAVFVAGFLKRLSNIEEDDVAKSVVEEWLKTPINLNKVKKIINKSIAIFSDNDPYVPIDNQEEYKNILGSKIVIKHKKGHFSGSEGTKSLQTALDAILEITN